MGEIIWGIDTNTSTTNYKPVKRYCRYTGNLCEVATDFGYCRLTDCANKTMLGGRCRTEEGVDDD